MRAAEIEAWARNVVDRVNAKLRVEDSRVECKGTWIEPEKAARRIAAHANAARGEGVLWIMGLDETVGVTGVQVTEFADWWARVRAQFDQGIAPSVQDVAVPLGEDKSIDALFMETDRAPYVVRNPGFGRGGDVREFEVPWREGTALRTASRADLLRVLVPRLREPGIEVMRAEATYWPGKPARELNSQLHVVLYVMP